MRFPHSRRWLREIGILLLIYSLLFLPWFQNNGRHTSRFANEELHITIMGWEFITDPQGDLDIFRLNVILMYSFFSLAYVSSRFLPAKWDWLALLPFLMAVILFISIIFYFAFFIRSFRGTHPFYIGGILPDAGVWLNGMAIILLLAGIVLTQTNRSRFLWGLVGGIGSWVCSCGLVFFTFAPFNLISTAFVLGFPLIGVALGMLLFNRRNWEANWPPPADDRNFTIYD
jgi:hypothetical protein